MKVLMWLSRGSSVPGGHRVQLEQTATALERMGVEVIRHFGPRLPEIQADIVHGFQLAADEVESARRRGLPVVISTIYVGLSYTAGDPTGRPNLRARLGKGRRAARYAVRSLAGREQLTRLAMREMHSELDQIKAWSMADLLLPNALGEARHIRDDLGVLTECRIVPNAVDAAAFSPGFRTPRPADTVLCVGRIEPHKNQLGVIRAINELPGTKLTVVGPPHPHHAGYYEECRKAARGNDVLFIGEIPYTELPAVYAAHSVHVLASWYETTGLVSLEAAASGCMVVTTNRGHAREYIRSDGFYCDPANPSTITDATRLALSSTPSTALLERVCSEYTWANTAEHTLSAYQHVLTRRGLS